MSIELQKEESSLELKKLSAKVKSAKTPKEVASILLEGNASLSGAEMFRLQDLANKTLEHLKQEEVDKLKVGVNQQSQDLALKTEKQIQQERDRHTSDVEPVYRKFDSISPKLLKEQENTIKNLDEALAINKKGEVISEELKNKLILSPQELEKRKGAWDVIDETFKVATQEKAHHQQRIAELNKMHPDLDSKPEEHPVRVQRELHQTLLSKADTKLQEVEKHYELRKEHAAKISQGIKETTPENKNLWAKRAEQFKREHKVSHEAILSAKSNEDIRQQRSEASEERLSNHEHGSSSKVNTTQSSGPLKNHVIEKLNGEVHKITEEMRKKTESRSQASGNDLESKKPIIEKIKTGQGRG